MSNKQILFIGSFKLPRNGHYGGVYFASTTLRDGLKKEGFQIIELDTTLKDITETRVYKRLPDILGRQFRFLYLIFRHSKAKFLFVFLSGGGSYVDKFLPILLAKCLRKKVVVFPRSGYLIQDHSKKKFKFFIDRIFKITDKIVCQSSFWEEYLLSKNVVSDKLVVVENWVDDKKIEDSRSLVYPRFEKEKDVFRIVFVSRLEKAKGIDDIIELGKQLKDKINFSIHVYGAGSYQNEFIENIKANNLEDLVFFKGWLAKEKMLKIINSYHIAIFPSKTEGYPNSLLDYVFSKIPIIASDIPMVVAVGGDKMSYFDKNNHNTLAQKVLFAQNNYHDLVKKSEYLYAEKVYSNNLVISVERIQEILNNFN